MNVLLWDNNEDDRTNLVRALSESDHEIQATGSIDVFRDLLGSRQWDLVVLDLLDQKEEDQRKERVKLSETAGYHLAKEVRAKDRFVLIFLVTRFSRIVIELGLERLGPPVFLDSKTGGFSWLASRIEQVVRLIRENEGLKGDKARLERQAEEHFRERSRTRAGNRRNVVASVGLLLFLVTIFSALILPEERSGTGIAKALLVFGLAVCGASGATISDVFWPKRRNPTTVVLVGATVGAALGLTYLLPIHQAAGTNFPGRGVLVVGALVAFFLGVAFEIAMLRVRDIGLEYVLGTSTDTLRRSGQALPDDRQSDIGEGG